MLTILSGVSIFLIITLVLVLILLLAKKYLVHSGKVKITINSDTVVEAESGKALLSTLADQNIFSPQPVVERAVAVSASVRCLPEAATYFPRRRSTSRARSSRHIGASAVR